MVNITFSLPMFLSMPKIPKITFTQSSTKFHEYFETIEGHKEFVFVFIWKPEVKGPDVQKLIFHITKKFFNVI